MDNLSGCIVSERNKKLLTRIEVRIESILKFDDICKDDIKEMIEDLALIQLQEEDRKHDVEFIPVDKEEERSTILAILDRGIEEKDPAPTRMISFNFVVTDSLGSKIGNLKVDAEDKTDAERKAKTAARKKFKEKKVDLKIK